VTDERDSDTRPADTQRLEAELTRGELPSLPPNQPKGMLGEKGLNLYKEESFTPDLNSGISQENDLPVVWLGILLAYIVFFPLAYWLLWRSRLFSRRSKIITSVIGAIGVVAVAVAAYSR
jgi:hypothetical protein